MKAAIVLNSNAGSIAAAEKNAFMTHVHDAFRRAGVETHVFPVQGDVRATVERAVRSDTDAVVVGGGDGTLGAGAAVLAGGSKPLGVLPLGTFNHFARDLGIPLELEQAVETIARGHVRTVDIGDVNGRVFLNNSSIGLYPMAVAQREELRHRRGGGKWWATLHACAAVFRRFPLLTVGLRAEQRMLRLTTPFVFVGNNRYAMSLLALGTRERLDAGLLSVYLTRDGGRLGLLRLALRALLGRLAQDRDFSAFVLPELQIQTHLRRVRVSLDGEVLWMSSPIRYTVRPLSLRVLAPPPSGAPSAA